jgi:hypothetical protein
MDMLSLGQVFHRIFYLRQRRGVAIRTACVSLIDGGWALC